MELPIVTLSSLTLSRPLVPRPRQRQAWQNLAEHGPSWPSEPLAAPHAGSRQLALSRLLGGTLSRLATRAQADMLGYRESRLCQVGHFLSEVLGPGCVLWRRAWLS